MIKYDKQLYPHITFINTNQKPGLRELLAAGGTVYVFCGFRDSFIFDDNPIN